MRSRIDFFSSGRLKFRGVAAHSVTHCPGWIKFLVALSRCSPRARSKRDWAVMIRWATRITVDRRMGPVVAEVAEITAAATALTALSVNGDGAPRWVLIATDPAVPAPDHLTHSPNYQTILPPCENWSNSLWSCPIRRCRMRIFLWNSSLWYVYLYLYSLKSLEWNLTENWINLEKEWLNFQSLKPVHKQFLYSRPSSVLRCHEPTRGPH